MPFFKIKRFGKSLIYAIKGLSQMLKEEQNLRFQTISGLLAIIAIFILPALNWQRVAIIIVVCLVICLELINSVIERISDILKPTIHHYVEQLKDIMAAAVFVASLGALTVGIIIFVPLIIKLF